MTATCATCGNILKNNAKFCSNKCQKDKEYKDYISRWRAGLETGARGVHTGNFSGHIIRYIHEKYDDMCARCSWHETNPYTSNIPLEIDHIDGNSENNTEQNLILLCPNCHALTKPYKNANKGSGRRWRKQKYMLQ